MSTRSFSSLVAQLNEAQAEAVRSMGFASFIKVYLKQIPRKFSKWLVESFELCAVCFRLLNGQTFPVTAFDVYTTLGVPLGGREIIVFDERKVQQNAPKLTRMSEFILAKKDGGESFKRNFIIHLVNCFFSGSKNHYCSKSILKYVKHVSQIPSLDWCPFVLDKLITSTANNDLCPPSFSPTLPPHKPNGEAQILGDTLVIDASVIVEKEDHHMDVVLD
ncbi:hypothetical protein Cgig2_014528 [Carnegiea gigantea]|uniref:Uncharacterized protein n=1 Tax=Carnegiea gigantea TaxID=171969 RepID=A0A9Q1GPI1_9CARY|nr:hypothetical protein Cgig2_014528 [Carnegiea gigantea]